MTKIQRKELAARQRKVVRERRAKLRRLIFRTKGYPLYDRNRVYRSFVETDLDPLLTVARLFVGGFYDEAYQVARRMDTVPREMIIPEIWDTIQVEHKCERCLGTGIDPDDGEGLHSCFVCDGRKYVA